MIAAMESRTAAAAAPAGLAVAARKRALAPTAVLWWVAGLSVLGIALRFPTLGLQATFRDGLDPALASAMSNAYNRWLADYCSTDPDRLFGIALVPITALLPLGKS